MKRIISLSIISTVIIATSVIFSCKKEKDETPPVITLIGDTLINVDKGTTYTDQGATAIDDVDGDISDQITVNNTVNTAEEGTYTVTYNVSDEAGNEAEEATRIVKVMIF